MQRHSYKRAGDLTVQIGRSICHHRDFSHNSPEASSFYYLKCSWECRWWGIKWWIRSGSEVAQSCPTLCDPMDSSLHQAPPSMGFSRQEYWSGLTHGPCQGLEQLPVSPGLRAAYGSELWSCLWYGACSAFTVCWISNNPCVLGEHCSFILAVEQQTEAVEWMQVQRPTNASAGIFLSWGIELYLESSQLNIWWQLDDSFVRFLRCMSPLHQWICFCSRQVVMTSSAWNAQKAVLQSHPILSSEFFLHFTVIFFFTVCINSPPEKIHW